LTPFAHGELCYGWSWTVQDEALLADQIARVALGQARHVAKILAGAQLAPPQTSAAAAAAAIAMLTVVGSDPSHRDGWMFQVMSWIAANRATPGAIIHPPHMILAHKGFDGLQLEVHRETRCVVAAIIFEDKATENPRDMVRDKVWPEFAKLEAGERENVLAAEVIALLERQPNIDVDNAIQNIIWKQARHYRVSVTVGDGHCDEAGRQRLFKVYDAVAVGAVRRRRSETFLIPELRAWMAQLAERAIAAVQEMAGAHVLTPTPSP
jgi:hypothetical protein